MSDQKIGMCRWCREKGEIYRDSLLCETCDSDTVYCSICRCRQHYESKCRHVFQDRDFQWCGSGVHPCAEDAKPAFHRLLSAMGEEFAVELKAAIRAGKFYTRLIAPMIGGGGILELHGMRDHARSWGDAMIRLGEGDRAERLADGYCWLASLYQRRTLKANRTTISWIDQWLWPFTPSLRKTVS